MSLGFIVSMPQKSQRSPPHHVCRSVQPLISGRSLTGDQFGSCVSLGLSVTTAAYVTFLLLGNDQRVVTKSSGTVSFTRPLK